MTNFSLHPFPGRTLRGMTIRGAIERTPQTLTLSFLLQGDLGDLLLPAATERTRSDDLWQSTCFEMFWAEEGKENYWELNLAPTGAWNVYAFTDYRAGMRRKERVAEPLIQIGRTPDSFSLTAELMIGTLHENTPSLRIGVSAVLRHQDSRLSHWALAHPENRPDFHASQSFLLRV